uniref:Reverse transcriptase domain-containing protein n=1 Tax=Macrostomum lignano TaxID=282301 RepID=A0A1I8H1X9_9PLAT
PATRRGRDRYSGDHGRRSRRETRAVCSVVNQLTGRERRNALKLAADTPEERRNELRTFFSGIVELPEESSFNISPITIDEVLQLAKKTPGNKATGPDDVPVEVLRLPQVALEVPFHQGQKTSRISLMSCTAKLFNRVPQSRLQPVLDPFLRREQNGFRPGRG